MGSTNRNELFHNIQPTHNYRYERKFTIPDDYSQNELLLQIKKNSFLFREIYNKRTVNNIYLDTNTYRDYFDNVVGVSERKKYRIRWYGETFGEVINPVLEVKIKNGLVGDKWSFKLKPFVIDDNFSSSMLQKVFSESNLPLSIKEGVSLLFPTLLNSYDRKYFLSADKKFRITLDYNLLYFKIRRSMNNFNSFPVRDINKILELKYNLEDDTLAKEVSTQFPFRMTKNSKYVNGVDAYNRFPQ